MHSSARCRTWAAHFTFWLHGKHWDLAWPIEYRTLRQDDLWISSARDRATVTLSVHQGVDQPDEALFRACETIFRQYEGRPHWGKAHFMKGHDFAGIHPRWQDWWRPASGHEHGSWLPEQLAAW